MGSLYYDNNRSNLCDLRDIQYCTQGYVFSWRKLTRKQQREFLDALYHSIDTLKNNDALLEYLFEREGNFEPLYRNGETQRNFRQSRINFFKRMMRELEVIYQSANNDPDLSIEVVNPIETMDNLQNAASIQNEESFDNQTLANSRSHTNIKIDSKNASPHFFI